MSDWIRFEGSISDDDGSTALLTAKSGGAFRLSSSSVQERNGEIFVQIGATCSDLDCPKGNCPHDQPDTEMVVMGGCDRTACIGLVEICCGSSRVLRACIGVWGC
ncbi:hypothetical protein [Vibrio parahaemolyticus]|uniref:hypothetical protein n=1 Tax=Vibrio parahaemolyticus TaxID=670 RepID=UPI00103810D2|nr:hypothetical protein [Vibrio parahaemolyticus]EJI1399427.1 hypothetical protein [Vibrio parahaemolyticus]MBM5032293.1 hypothetical protein [Vibrio parahaemolyticus]MCX8941438.1 hypothetical protein [Vibrio parahaemolyticus]MDF5575999.1 hypothetical protein [Vibrio parahaemolyticus]MDG2903584.1 hypothetical protein [Vibrio parahaemolyticus]